MTQQLTRCANCPHQFGKLVGSKGPEHSPLMIIGESPGVMEMRKGEPFVGPSGTILDAGLAQHPETAKRGSLLPFTAEGGSLEPYITNAIICFPGTTQQKNQDRLAQAVICCHHRLEEEIERVSPRVILSLGTPAIQSLTGNSSLKITQVRGKVFEYKGIPIVAAVHPSYLMHGGGSLRQFLNDVDYAVSLCKGADYRKYIIPEYRVLENTDEIEQLANQLRTLPEGTPVAADCETGGFNGFDYLRDRILCAGICFDPHIVWVLPEALVHYSGDLFDNRVRYVWHNGKFDAKFLLTSGVVDVRVDDDTMLLSYALDEVKGIHDLESVASDILGAPDWKFMIKPYLDEWKANHKGKTLPGYEMVPREILYDYMGRDISSTLQVFPVLRRMVSQDPLLERLYTRTLMPASDYLIKVEMVGLKLDLKQVEENTKRLSTGNLEKGTIGEIPRLEEEINQISRNAGHTNINPNSWQQLGVLLFDVLKIPHKNRETNVKALDKLPDHPAIRALKKYRKVQKAFSTYVKPASDWVNKDGRVHTTYKIPGTSTGRLASEDPNLLNIPRDPLLRGMFVADKGKVYLEVDANQAELRVLAELSGDDLMTKIYTTAGMSLHDETTHAIWKYIDQYTPQELEYWINKFNVHNFPEKLYDEQKMRAKNVNFGIVYGITSFGLSEQTDFPVKDCQQWLNVWFAKYPKAATFIRKCREAPQQNKTLVTPFGRKRRFGVVSPERIVDIQNQAANFPEQSIASDIVLHTGFAMEPIARRMGVPICNTIYDSILYEAPQDETLCRELAAQTISCLAETAQEWGLKRIPFLGEAKVGQRWGNLINIDKFFKPKVLAA